MGKSSIAKIWLAVMVLSLFGVSMAVAQESPLSRGKAIDMMVGYFDLTAKNQIFLKDCRLAPETCLFAFSARTNFNDFRLDPLILYPDVYPAYRYYEAINIASMLDLASGYYMEADSPFRPEQAITKVETLKLVMGASGMMNWKEKFELSTQDQSWLTISLDGERWWYSRYLATALSEGFIDQVSQEEAESTVSETELLKIMEGANRIVASRQSSSPVDIYGQSNKKADTSGNTAL